MKEETGKIKGQDWQYIPPSDVFETDWTEANLAELWEFAQHMPRKRDQHVYGKVKLPRWTCKNPSHPTKWSADFPKPQKSKAKSPARGFVSSEAKPKCPICGSEDVKPVNKLIVDVGSYSISPKNESSQHHTLVDAPPIVQKLAAKLTRMNGGKDINYLSFIAYENARDHIGWHQHNEDRCRDAKVYILSMGEKRIFGIRRVCEKHRLPHPKCIAQCATTCLDGPTALCRKCSSQMNARDTCSKCESIPPDYKGKRKGQKWTEFEPDHGSIIVLEAAANETVEHAVLQDKGEKGLRISINTKNVRPQDIKAVEGAGTTRLIPSGTLRKVSPQVNSPPVYSIKREHPSDAIYVGCAGGWECCKCHEPSVRSGSMYGNSYTPRKWGGHKQNPIAKTPEEYRKKLDKKWKSDEPNDVAWKEKAIKDLRGKNLLCWCLQPGDVGGPEGCHARVLFEYVNRP